MTDTTMPTAKPPLGVGNILGESFSLYFGNFVPMTVVALVPLLISYAVSFAVVGVPDPADVIASESDPFYMYRENGFLLLLTSLVGMAAWGFTMAAITRLAYDAKLGNPVSIAEGIRAGLSNLVVVAICIVIASIVGAVGLMLLIIPGLIILAAWSVIVPSIVVEKSGFGCFRRSWSLTKEYRWPLIGLFVLFVLILVVVSLIVGVITAAVTLGAVSGGDFQGSFTTGMIVSMVLNAIVTVITYGISGALGALSYARLVEIKEGTSIRTLADVFS